jgi:hypothetical protein
LYTTGDKGDFFLFICKGLAPWKKDFISSLANCLKLIRLPTVKKTPTIKLVNLIQNSLEEKHLLIYFNSHDHHELTEAMPKGFAYG